MAPLQGKRVLVTAAAQGLGAATARALAQAGAHVIVGDLNEEGARRVAGSLADGALAIGFDVGDEREVEQVMKQIAERHGGLDAAVNNAAIDFTLPLEELSVERWDAVMRVNLRGPFLVAKQAAAMMR